MPEAVAALIGALIGGLASVAGALVATRATASAEDRRAAVARKVARSERQQAQLVEVIRLSFEVEARVFEAAWIAKSRPENIDQDYADSYETTMTRLLPEYSGAVVALSGMAPSVHRELATWVEEMLQFESITSNALLRHGVTNDTADALAPLHGRLQDFYRSAPDRIAPAFAAAGLREEW